MKVYAFILGVKSGKFQGDKDSKHSHHLLCIYQFVIYLASVELLICFQVTRASHQISVGSTLLYLLPGRSLTEELIAIDAQLLQFNLVLANIFLPSFM